MLALLGISTLASLVASSVLGVRLLRLASRTRELPEALMGTAFLVSGVIGYVVMLVGVGGAKAMPPETSEAFFLAGYALISFGVILHYTFIWKVFRPTSSLTRAAVVVAAVAIAGTSHPIALPSLSGGAAPGSPTEGLSAFAFWLGHALRMGGGLWGTFEAGTYYLSLRRRMRLGLADPIVANRILLWTFAAVGGAVIFGATAISNVSGGSVDEVMGTAEILLVSTVTFMVAGCQWFAFLPPRRYLAWLGRRGASTPA